MSVSELFISGLLLYGFGLCVGIVLWRKLLVPWTANEALRLWRAELGADASESIPDAIARQVRTKLPDADALRTSFREEVAQLIEAAVPDLDPAVLGDQLATRLAERLVQDVQSEKSTLLAIAQKLSERTSTHDRAVELGQLSGQARRARKEQRDAFAGVLGNPLYAKLFLSLDTQTQDLIMAHPEQLDSLLSGKGFAGLAAMNTGTGTNKLGWG